MPSLATTNRFQQIDQKSLQTFMALSDLGLGHVTDYHGLKRVSILNVVILGTSRISLAHPFFSTWTRVGPASSLITSGYPASKTETLYSPPARPSKTNLPSRSDCVWRRPWPESSSRMAPEAGSF